MHVVVVVIVMVVIVCVMRAIEMIVIVGMIGIVIVLMIVPMIVLDARSGGCEDRETAISFGSHVRKPGCQSLEHPVSSVSRDPSTSPIRKAEFASIVEKSGP